MRVTTHFTHSTREFVVLLVVVTAIPAVHAKTKTKVLDCSTVPYGSTNIVVDRDYNWNFEGDTARFKRYYPSAGAVQLVSADDEMMAQSITMDVYVSLSAAGLNNMVQLSVGVSFIVTPTAGGAGGWRRYTATASWPEGQRELVLTILDNSLWDTFVPQLATITILGNSTFEDGTVCSTNTECTGSNCRDRCCKTGISEQCFACDSAGSCTSCSEQYYIADGNCTMKKANGTACSNNNECISSQCFHQCCKTDVGMQCTACDSDGSCKSCSAGYSIIDGVCVQDGSDGTACTEDNQCLNFTCHRRCCKTGLSSHCTLCDSEGSCASLVLDCSTVPDGSTNIVVDSGQIENFDGGTGRLKRYYPDIATVPLLTSTDGMMAQTIVMVVYVHMNTAMPSQKMTLNVAANFTNTLIGPTGGGWTRYNVTVSLREPQSDIQLRILNSVEWPTYSPEVGSITLSSDKLVGVGGICTADDQCTGSHCHGRCCKSGIIAQCTACDYGGNCTSCSEGYLSRGNCDVPANFDFTANIELPSGIHLNQYPWDTNLCEMTGTPTFSSDGVRIPLDGSADSCIGTLVQSTKAYGPHGLFCALIGVHGPVPQGTVGGVMYLISEWAKGGPWNEVDYELFGYDQDIHTNLFSGTFDDEGVQDKPRSHSFNFSQQQREFCFLITPSSLQFSIDDSIIRSESDLIPVQPLQMSFNVWVPTEDWAGERLSEYSYALIVSKASYTPLADPHTLPNGWDCIDHTECTSSICRVRCCKNGISPHCTGCALAGSCTSCSEGYYVADGNCTMKKANGTACSNNNECISSACHERCCKTHISTQCKTCSSDGSCTSCSEQYYIADGNCVQQKADGTSDKISAVLVVVFVVLLIVILVLLFIVVKVVQRYLDRQIPPNQEKPEETGEGDGNTEMGRVPEIVTDSRRGITHSV